MAQMVVSGGSSRPAGVLAVMAAAVESFRRRQRRADALREIARMTPKMLRDLGVEQADVATVAGALADRDRELVQVAATTPSFRPSLPFALSLSDRGTAMA